MAAMSEEFDLFVQGALVATKERLTDYEQRIKNLESIVKILDLRCTALYANHNRCVRPVGHIEPHLTESGYSWTR
jgi:hypothetical protein